MKHILKTLTIAPLFVVIASCASTSSSNAPVAHRHAELVHSHALEHTTGIDHHHGKLPTKPTKKIVVKIAKKKIVVPVTPAKPADIKPLGLKGLGHKHHNHVDPKTSVEGVPC